MKPVHHKALLLAGCIVAWALPSAYGDTVYLKNGAWIDGRVHSRTDKLVEVEIGKVGKVEIPVDEIYDIEKNNRTGDEVPESAAKLDPVAEQLKQEGAKGDPAAPGAAAAPAAEKQLSESASSAKAEEDSASRGPASRAGDLELPPEEEEDEAPPIGKTARGASGQPQAGADGDLDPQLKARINELVDDLKRQKAQVRARAERHLRSIGSATVPFLVPVAKDKSNSDLTRIAVFRLFNEFGDDLVVEACIDALLDPNEFVRSFANKTLERVTHENFGYQPQASPMRRELAAAKWQKWWDEEKKALEEERQLGSSSSKGDAKTGTAAHKK